MSDLADTKKVLRYLIRVIIGFILLPIVFFILCPVIKFIDYIVDDKTGGAKELLTDTFGLVLWRTL